MTDLLIESENRDSNHFWMDSIEVDGITGERNSDFVKFMFSLKTEIGMDDQPLDTGKPMHWNPDLIVSEKHWLSCGVVIPLHSQCMMCGERE